MSEDQSAESFDEDHEYYTYLREGHAAATRSYDKVVLTLAGGALTLSVTFAGKIVGESPSDRGWLAFGWATLVIALLALSASYLSSERMFWHKLHDRNEKAERWDTGTGWLNVGAGVSLAVGLGALAVFAFHNL